MSLMLILKVVQFVGMSKFAQALICLINGWFYLIRLNIEVVSEREGVWNLVIEEFLTIFLRHV